MLQVKPGTPGQKPPGAPAPVDLKTSFNPDGTMVMSTPGASAPAFPGLSADLIAALIARDQPSAAPPMSRGGGRYETASARAMAPAEPYRGAMGASPKMRPRRQVIREADPSKTYMPQWAGTAAGGLGRGAYSYDPDLVEYEREPKVAFAGRLDTQADKEMRMRHNRPIHHQAGG